MRIEIDAQAWYELESILLKLGIEYITHFVKEEESVCLNVDINSLKVKPEGE